MKWNKLGRIIAPDPGIFWLADYTGPSFADVDDENSDLISIYVTGRDEKNRSRIGVVKFDMKEMRVKSVTPEPVLSLGEKGSFDQNGTGYPCIVHADGKKFMYYVGWVPSVLVSFHNECGLAAESSNGQFERVSKAGILPPTPEEYLGIGSSYVLRENPNTWKMWYTCFHKWGDESKGEHKHYYDIKYAESRDGICWYRPDVLCVTFKDAGEYAIGKPSVLFHDGRYHMWYVYRGESYKIGYAVSNDGKNWTRQDHLAGIDWSESGWDSEMVCYPHCFFWKKQLYMLYNGNGYGKTGVGLARLESW